jgi:3-oxoadipate enol-lactonase
MGGLIGQWLANHNPDRLNSATICDTAARIGAAEMWNARIAKVETEGLAGIVDSVTSRWLTEPFVQKFPQTLQSVRAMLLGNSAEGYAACCGAIRDADFTNAAPAKVVPMLVITGAQDLVTPPSDAQFLVGKYPGAKYAELNGGHLSNVEDAAGFTRALSDFIAQVEA